ncbi:MAG: hypothetical protein IPM63_15710 [Acidobacteriota bacterium]|nr:MAG: hypothetical protein IPM63_15710 [Acidobacteriota bacterium]
MKNYRKTYCLAAMLCLTASVFAFAGGEPERRSRRDSTYEIKAVPWGPNGEQIESARRRVLGSPEVKDLLGSTAHRLLAFNSEDRADSNKNSLPPTHFLAVFYDYTNDRTFIARGDYAGRERISVSESDLRMDVSATHEEILDAFEVVSRDPDLGAAYKRGKIELFAPMPPLSFINGERLVNIGVRDNASGVDRIIGVSFKNGKVVDYGEDAPRASVTGSNCGIPNSGQGASTSGTGTLAVTTSISQQTIWEMIVVRPSMSSGNVNEGSGIEVRDVKYKGKSVLKRGHAPILNVKYHPGGCGNFRDWQNAEGFFQAPDAGSSEPVPGYRQLATGQVAQTAVESGNDSGNFQGVAIYQQDVGLGLELVLVTEMNAGWYRYIMEWRFAEDGTIRPRYGFGSVSSGCVCAARNHHVYWRFDFDIVSPNNDVYKVERGRKFLSPITTETKMFRNYQTNRSILIENSDGDEAYTIVPNITDEEAYNLEGSVLQTFGAGDLWILKFAGSENSPGEIDDPNSTNAANIDPWVNSEAIGNSDAVIWYGAHQFRNDATSLTNFDRSGLVMGGVHTVGPDLRPVRW